MLLSALATEVDIRALLPENGTYLPSRIKNYHGYFLDVVPQTVPRSTGLFLFSDNTVMLSIGGYRMITFLPNNTVHVGAEQPDPHDGCQRFRLVEADTPAFGFCFQNVGTGTFLGLREIKDQEWSSVWVLGGESRTCGPSESWSVVTAFHESILA